MAMLPAAVLVKIAVAALRYKGNQKAWMGAASTMISVGAALTIGGDLPPTEEIGSAIAVLGSGIGSYAGVWWKTNRKPSRTRKRAIQASQATGAIAPARAQSTAA